MKTCPKCSFRNSFDSLFCQECGYRFPETSKTKKSFKYVWTCGYCGKEFATKKACDAHEKKCPQKPDQNSIYHKLNNNHDLDDVIFQPEKRKRHVLRSVLTIICVFFAFIFGIVILVAIIDESNTNYDNYPTPTISKSFPLYQLSIESIDSEWIGYGQNAILYIKGTLKNLSSISAKNIEIRVDLYRDKENKNLLDTRFFTVTGVANNGAYTFREPIGSFNSSVKFWYTTQIINADYY